MDGGMWGMEGDGGEWIGKMGNRCGNVWNGWERRKMDAVGWEWIGEVWIEWEKAGMDGGMWGMSFR